MHCSFSETYIYAYKVYMSYRIYKSIYITLSYDNICTQTHTHGHNPCSGEGGCLLNDHGPFAVQSIQKVHACVHRFLLPRPLIHELRILLHHRGAGVKKGKGRAGAEPKK